MAYGIDVNAAGCDVGGHQGANLTSLEGGQGAFPLTLALVAMDGGCIHAALLQRLGHPVCATLGPCKDDDPFELFFGEQFSQKGALAGALNEDDLLVDLFDRGGLGCHRHLQGIWVEQFPSQLANFGGHGGGEEQVLALLWQVLHQLTDWHDEAHVKHLVGFIQDKNFDACQGDGLFAQVIEQATGGGDKHVNPWCHGPHLTAVLHAAEHDGDRDAHVFAIGLEALADLCGELTSGRQH